MEVRDQSPRIMTSDLKDKAATEKSNRFVQGRRSTRTPARFSYIILVRPSYLHTVRLNKSPNPAQENLIALATLSDKCG